MIVVADTSPLIVLVTIGHIDLLPALFGHVIVPPEVLTELASTKRRDDIQQFASSLPAWLLVQATEQPQRIEGLHDGESAAIALALERKAERLLIDEILGRTVAIDRGISVIGTIGVLETAARLHRLDLADAFERVKQTDFWVGAAFLDERLAFFHKRERRN